VWKRLTSEPVQPEGEVLAETERRVFVGILPRSIPYPPGSADAAAFDSMAMNLAQLGALFSLVPEVAQAPRPRAVSGTVTYRQRIALPRDAVLVVELRDTSRADAPAVVLAERRIPVEGRQVPLPFELPLPSEPMRPGARTTLSARIYVGDRLAFINDRAVVPVLGADAPPTEIVVVPVGAPLPEPAKRGG
jgi:putative lipoprotein